MENLENFTVKALREIAKDLGIKGISSLKKNELITAIIKSSDESRNKHEDTGPSDEASSNDKTETEREILEDLTVKELREIAKNLEINGRSSLKKNELITAIIKSSDESRNKHRASDEAGPSDKPSDESRNKHEDTGSSDKPSDESRNKHEDTGSSDKPNDESRNKDEDEDIGPSDDDEELPDSRISDNIRSIVHPTKHDLFYKRLTVKYLLRIAKKMKIDIVITENKSSLFNKIFIVHNSTLEDAFSNLNIENLRGLKSKLKIKSGQLKIEIIKSIIEFFTIEGEYDGSAVSKRKSISQALRLAVWRTYCGDAIEHKCLCCDTLMMHHIEGSHDWECGHVLSVADGGDTILSNLRPICVACNRSMGKTHMDEFKKKFR